ncbi:Pycsar system effector family protein [Streptomyces longispororuber]|uniref:Pycsar system effector family protein n=1 Tax=Streptomyces longispororuber TaxID=68230 RepID=UPI0036FBDC95
MRPRTLTPAQAARADANLNTAVERTKNEIVHADNKAVGVLTVAGILTAAITVIAPEARGAALAAVLIGAAALVAATVLALLVFHPRLRVRGVDPHRSSFVYWATATTQDVKASMREDQRLLSVRVQSMIALRKMRLLRAGGICAVAAVIAIVAAASLSALTR